MRRQAILSSSAIVIEVTQERDLGAVMQQLLIHPPGDVEEGQGDSVARLSIDIRPLGDDDIPTAERRLTAEKAGKHRERLHRQYLGHAVYLIAWDQSSPVGHAFLKFTGVVETEVRDQIGICPDLEDVWVVPERRSEGIGSHLLKFAEATATDRRFDRIGLGVSLDNPRARALYERLGYRDIGIEYTVRYLKSQGFRQDFEERCIYLVKDLRPTAN